MGAKKQQRLVVGRWDEAGEAFAALDVQPDAPITDMTKMIAWAKIALKDTPGSYDFVRRVPGQLVVAVQQKLDIKFVA